MASPVTRCAGVTRQTGLHVAPVVSRFTPSHVLYRGTPVFTFKGEKAAAGYPVSVRDDVQPRCPFVMKVTLERLVAELKCADRLCGRCSAPLPLILGRAASQPVLRASRQMERGMPSFGFACEAITGSGQESNHELE